MSVWRSCRAEVKAMSKGVLGWEVGHNKQSASESFLKCHFCLSHVPDVFPTSLTTLGFLLA